MAAQKFLTNNAGRVTEAQALSVSSGAGDVDKLVALDATGKIPSGFLPSTSAPNQSVVSSENLSAGNVVNVYNNAGTLNVRKADNAAAGKEANGFVLAGVTSPAAGTVTFVGGVITGLSSLTPGARYYLGVAGAVTATAPTASGAIVQCVGIALSATTLLFNPEDPITLV
jgi:hypothetical protein